MTALKKLRIGVASALVMAMPLQAVSAATRPSAAVPAAAATVAADNRDVCDLRDGVDGRDRLCGSRAGWAWPAIGVILGGIILAIVLESHNGSGRGTGFSR